MDVKQDLIDHFSVSMLEGDFLPPLAHTELVKEEPNLSYCINKVVVKMDSMYIL